jgi:hypothetical protein
MASLKSWPDTCITTNNKSLLKSSCSKLTKVLPQRYLVPFLNLTVTRYTFNNFSTQSDNAQSTSLLMNSNKEVNLECYKHGSNNQATWVSKSLLFTMP